MLLLARGSTWLEFNVLNLARAALRVSVVLLLYDHSEELQAREAQERERREREERERQALEDARARLEEELARERALHAQREQERREREEQERQALEAERARLAQELARSEQQTAHERELRTRAEADRERAEAERARLLVCSPSARCCPLPLAESH